jgi:hypothetical protein
MPLNGTNKKCQQCLRSCKQWFQNIILSCRNFESKQKQIGKQKNNGTLCA